MMAGLLLDGLLILVVALYIPIGGLRGGLREALLGGAILLGAASADALAPAWGDALAEATGIEEATGRFVVAVALLLAVGLGVGFGAGAMVGAGAPGFESRIAGGLVGCLNAVVLLSFSLAFLNEHLHDGRTNKTVAAGWFADGLAEHQGWVIGLALLLAAGLVVAYRLMARFEDEVVQAPVAWAESATPATRRRVAVAPPSDPDGGKVESSESTVEGAGWARLNAEAAVSPLERQTRSVVPSPGGAEGLAVGHGPPGGAGNGRSRRAEVGGAGTNGGGTVVDEWLRRAAARPHPLSGAGGQDRAGADERAGSGERPDLFTDAALRNLLDPRPRPEQRPLPSVNPHAGLIPTVEPESVDHPSGRSDRKPGSGALEPVRRCDVCGTPAATDLANCPFCGSPL